MRQACAACCGHVPAVNDTAADGTTALYWAARGDHLPIVRLLLRAGARVDAADRYGITPLALAAINGSAPVVSALLEAGANAKGACRRWRDGADGRGAYRPCRRHQAPA